MVASDQTFWVLSRGFGIAAITLASLSVSAGLLSGRGLKLGTRRPRDGKAIHEALSVATMIAIVLHGALLLGDTWLRPGLSGLLIPFAMSYRPFWTGLGVIAGYGIIVLGVTYYFRARIGVARWRTLHRFIALFWIAGFVHALGAGSDIGELWLWAVLLAPAVPAFVLLGMRFGDAGGAGRTKTRPAGGSRPAQRKVRPSPR